jgi:hypothetical protein
MFMEHFYVVYIHNLKKRITCVKNLSFSMLMVLSCNITLRMVANTIDEDYKLGESTNMEAINHFNIGI